MSYLLGAVPCINKFRTEPNKKEGHPGSRWGLQLKALGLEFRESAKLARRIASYGSPGRI